MNEKESGGKERCRVDECMDGWMDGEMGINVTVNVSFAE